MCITHLSVCNKKQGVAIQNVTHESVAPSEHHVLSSSMHKVTYADQAGTVGKHKQEMLAKGLALLGKVPVMQLQIPDCTS